MKNKKYFFIIFLLYIFLYNVIIEIMTSLINTDRETFFNPLGRLFRKTILSQDIDSYTLPEIIIFLYNLFVCTILFALSCKWFSDYNTWKTLFKLVISFVLISMITWYVVSWDGIGMSTIAVFILYYVCPIFVMVILTLPFFWFINKKTSLNRKI
jgi:hypothetical protein